MNVSKLHPKFVCLCPLKLLNVDFENNAKNSNQNLLAYYFIIKVMLLGFFFFVSDIFQFKGFGSIFICFLSFSFRPYLLSRVVIMNSTIGSSSNICRLSMWLLLPIQTFSNNLKWQRILFQIFLCWLQIRRGKLTCIYLDILW